MYRLLSSQVEVASSRTPVMSEVVFKVILLGEAKQQKLVLEERV